MSIKTFLKVSLLLFLMACSHEESKNNIQSAGYDFTSPVSIIELPSILHEVSGISILDSSNIGFIQDEKGILFFYNLKGKEISREYPFGPNGDYEDITKIDDTIYILQSDGILLEIIDYKQTGSLLNRYETGIPCIDSEGLCYDKAQHQLLIACKIPPKKGQKLNKKRMIFSFDLRQKKLNTEPALVVNIEELNAFLGKEAGIKFRPSALGIHPVNKKLYILSAAEYLLFIFDVNGNLLHIEKLDPELFNKAEGMTFLENGDLFISNEGQDKEPTLLKFTYNPIVSGKF